MRTNPHRQRPSNLKAVAMRRKPPKLVWSRKLEEEGKCKPLPKPRKRKKPKTKA